MIKRLIRVIALQFVSVLWQPLVMNLTKEKIVVTDVGLLIAKNTTLKLSTPNILPCSSVGRAPDC